jgi:aarF domain-containing kinase
LGQWASTRRDLFPQNACEELSQLQDKVNPHAFHYTLAALEKEFGRQRVNECFLDIEPEPIGVGAVSQVHMATVKHPSFQQVQKCAVKVLHPGVEELIATDLSIIRGLAAIVNNIIPGAHWMSFPEEATYFSDMMTQQLDLRREAVNLNKFRKNFRDWPNVYFPSPIDHLVSQTVLVEELIDGGIPIEKVLKVADSSLKSQLATIGLDSFLVCRVVSHSSFDRKC